MVVFAPLCFLIHIACGCIKSPVNPWVSHLKRSTTCDNAGNVSFVFPLSGCFYFKPIFSLFKINKNPPQPELTEHILMLEWMQNEAS